MADQNFIKYNPYNYNKCQRDKFQILIKSLDKIELSINKRIEKNKIQINFLNNLMKETLTSYQIICKNLYAPGKPEPAKD